MTPTRRPSRSRGRAMSGGRARDASGVWTIAITPTTSRPFAPREREVVDVDDRQVGLAAEQRP